MNPEDYCLYCQVRKAQAAWLKPIHDWSNPDKLVGYYCEKHYDGVRSFQSAQRKSYEAYKGGTTYGR